MNNFKKKVIFSIFAILFMLPSVGLYAQNKTITGTITEENGDAIIGASIMLKGTNNGTVTDFDGNFSLSVPNDAKTLVISYIGMKTQEVAIKGTTIDLVMAPDEKTNLDELVVIGYGAVKKRDLTGSVASVDGKALRDIPVTTAAEAITGKLAGVQVTTTEGSPDAEVKIRVRGGGSLTGDNTPLYIVDGFPVTSISDISPSDIQSIDVLKDASSTAIYGARGANGVIIVTTKAPKEGKFSVSYDGYIGFKKIAKTLDILSPYEFVKWQYEQAALNDKVQEQYVNYFGTYEDMDIYKSISGTDYQDEIFGRTGVTSNHNFSISGGSDKVSYNVSYSRTDDKAIMIESDYYRNNLNLKLNLKPYKNLKINLSGRYSETSATGAGANDSKNGKETSSDTRMKQAIIYAPIDVKNLLSSSESDDEETIGSLYPPKQVVYDNYRNKLTKRYNFNSSVSYDFIKGLTARVEFGIDDEYYYDNRYYGASTDYHRNKQTPDTRKTGGSISMIDRNTRTIRNTNTITYDKKKIFGENHNMSIMLGEETLSTAKSQQTVLSEGVPWSIEPEDSFNFAGAAQNIVEASYFKSRNSNMLSFFGRLNYDYAGKYLLTATFREDGSSKFAKGNQWGFFPSVALAWRASDEEFMQSASDWLSNLKLRLSYGTAGNNNVEGSYESMYSAKNTNYISEGKVYWSNGTIISNPDLTWETTVTRNLGLDFGFLGGRISGAVDLYYNSTKDLLINLTTSGTGYESIPINMGETSNKGLEISVNTVILDKPDYGLDFNFNVGWNKNKIKSLGGLSRLEQSSGWHSLIDVDYVASVGSSIGEMYGYVTDGFYSVDDFEYVNGKWVANEGVVDNSGNTGVAWGPGALKLKDIDDDGVITEKDRTIIGNANPKATGGFSLSGRYKGFDLSANFTWSYGNDILNANKIEFTSNNNSNLKYRNMTTEMASGNRWTNIDPATGQIVTDKATLAALNENATLWSPNTKFLFHSWAVEDGSFLRLNSITLGYTLPKALVKKASLQNVRFYATASNLFCITSYSGFDPEVDSRRKSPLTPGVDYSAYPKSRGFNFGVNLTF